MSASFIDKNVHTLSKFNGSNYNQWKYMITCCLQGKQLYKVTDGSDKKPAEAGASMDEWIKKDAQARFIMTASMEWNIISLIENCETAEEMLAKLNNIYGRKSDLDKMLASDEFHNYRMDPGDSIITHMAKVENLAQRIKDTGEKISDVMIMTKILNTLPSKFKTVRQAWLSVEDTKRTLENLRARLIDEESNLNLTECGGEALFSYNRNYQGHRGQNFRGRKQFNNFNRSHSNNRSSGEMNKSDFNNRQSGSNYNRSYSEDREMNKPHFSQSNNDFRRSYSTNHTVICFKCQNPGHFARDCRNFPSRGDSANHAPYDNKNSASGNKSEYSKQSKMNDDYYDGSAFCADSNFDDASYLSSEWLMDSGASKHMTHESAYFQNLEPASGEITVGSNEKLEVVGHGTVHIRKLVNGNWSVGKIENVLLVPRLKRNLFSEGALTRRGMKIVKENDYVNVFNRDGELVAEGLRCANNLYRMHFKTKIFHEANLSVETNNLKLWHERMGHLNIKSLKRMVNKKLVTGISLNDCNKFFCEGCAYGKQHRAPFKRSIRIKPNKPGELIYSDVSGAMPVATPKGKRFFVLFKDAFTGYRVVYFLRHKSDVPECIKIYNNKLKNKFGSSMKIFHSDNGGEYIGDEVLEYFKQEGIEFEKTAPYTPEQNGRSERELQTIVNCATSMLQAKNLPEFLWAEAVNTEIYLLNRSLTTQSEVTALEGWIGQKPALDHVKIFGSDAYVFIDASKRKKFQKKSEKMIFVGYEENTSNYRFMNLQTNRVIISRNAIFNEFDSNEQTLKETGIAVLDYSSSSESENDKNLVNERDANEEINANVEIDDEDLILAQRRYGLIESDTVANENVVKSSRQRTAPKHLSAYEVKLPPSLAGLEANIAAQDIFEPQTYEEAMKSKECGLWKKAMDEELDAFEKNNVWEVVKRPVNKTIVDSRWVFKIKDGKRFKARLCAKGFKQIRGIDYDETFAPTTRYDSIRLLLSIAAERKLEIKQFDIKTAFLHGELQEEIYLSPPEGMEVNANEVCKLNKSVYGLKQASRCWNSKFDEFLKSLSLQPSQADPCVYHGVILESEVIIALFVDDGLILAKDKKILDFALNKMNEKFEITASDPNVFIGMEIKRFPDGSIFMNQADYIERLIERFGMKNAYESNIPADPNVNLESCDQNIDYIDVPYREAVGSLMFLSVVSRPDISYAVGMVARFVNSPNQACWNAVKKIIRYLMKTRSLGIYYSGLSQELMGFADADHANDQNSRKSITGYVSLLNGSVVTWCSQKQRIVALSSMEAEYVAASTAAQELLWIRQFLKDVGVSVKNATKLFIDNQSAIALVKNNVYHKRSKHIDVRYHHIRDLQKRKILDVKYINTVDQTADMFTKALPFKSFSSFTEKLGMRRDE